MIHRNKIHSTGAFNLSNFADDAKVDLSSYKNLNAGSVDNGSSMIAGGTSIKRAR